MKKRHSRIALTLVLILLAACMLYPVYFLVISSFKPVAHMFSQGITLSLEDMATLENYRALGDYRKGMYFDWYGNSVLITCLQTICSLFFSSMAGYALAVYIFRGRNLVFTLMLLVMMIPLEIIMLPLYKLTITMGIINSPAGIILPFMLAPVAIFFFRQYVSGLSGTYVEAGRIDGCTELGIYFKIMVPLMKPAFGAMTILLAMSSWNSFLWPLIVLRTNNNLTLPVGLSALIGTGQQKYEVLLPGAVLAIVPMVAVFLLNQRSFINGLTAGGVKA